MLIKGMSEHLLAILHSDIFVTILNKNSIFLFQHKYFLTTQEIILAFILLQGNSWVS